MMSEPDKHQAKEAGKRLACRLQAQRHSPRDQEGERRTTNAGTMVIKIPPGREPDSETEQIGGTKRTCS